MAEVRDHFTDMSNNPLMSVEVQHFNKPQPSQPSHDNQSTSYNINMDANTNTNSTSNLERHMDNDSMLPVFKTTFDPLINNNPESNQILEQEQLLIESKREKLVEVFRNSNEVHDLLMEAKTNRYLCNMNLDL